MITILTVLACIGLLLSIIGRWLILSDAGELSAGWRMAIRFLPFADIVHLAGSWEKAKGGAICAVMGLALTLPWQGQIVWNLKNPNAGRSEALMLRVRLAGLVGEGFLSREAADARENRLKHKDEKVHELSAELNRWYAALEVGRAALLAGQPVDGEALNAEIAAYHSLLAVGREELSDFTAMTKAKVKPVKR